MTRTISDVAVGVLRLTGNPGIMWGDSGLLDEVWFEAHPPPAPAPAPHPLDRWKSVLAGLERDPARFEKSFIHIEGRAFRVFTLKEVAT